MAEQESKILRVGLVGAGIIGGVHRAAYDQHPAAEVVALADPRGEEVLNQEAAAYVPKSGATSGAKLPVYKSLAELVAAEDVDAIDICTPTPFHRDLVIEALNAGKHVLSEKPMGRTLADCDAILEVAKSSDCKYMVAHCLRFWPVYEYLNEAVTSGKYGRVERASFARQVIVPEGGWFLDGKMSGGAILDLHIHDVDVAAWIMGAPRAISAYGRIGPTGCHDQVVAIWHYDDDRLVQIEATWYKAAPGAFSMSFEMAMEGATVTCDSNRDPNLLLSVPGEESTSPELPEEDGYVREVDYFVRCVLEDKPIERATGQSSRDTIALIEREIESIASGRTVEL